MAAPKCKTCMYFTMKVDENFYNYVPHGQPGRDKDAGYGPCSRFPPTVPYNDGEIHSHRNVSAEDRCGEYRVALERLIIKKEAT